MKWYVKLPENDKVAVLAFVQKGMYKKHIPSVADDLYNIYLDESALAMWMEAQEMKKVAQDEAEQAAADKLRERMESRLRERLLFPQEYDAEKAEERLKNALKAKKAAEEAETAARVAAQRAAQLEAAAQQRARIEAANRFVAKARIEAARLLQMQQAANRCLADKEARQAKAKRGRQEVAEAPPKAKRGRPAKKAAEDLEAYLPDCLNPDKVPPIFIPVTPDGKADAKEKKEKKAKTESSKKDDAKEKKDKKDKKDKKEKKANKEASQQYSEPSAPGLFL